MEEKHTQGQCSCSGGLIASAAPFFIGLAVSLAVGWFLFPKVLYSKSEQPIRFSHKVHMEGAGMECKQCHFFNADGSYNGIPTTKACAECHADVIGSDPDEKKFVESYVKPEKEVKWLTYQYQPDNVFFSHAAHNFENCTKCHPDLYKTEGDLCGACHPKDIGKSDTPPAHEKNIVTGYSKTTMKMWECERCHANENHRGTTTASNACFVCHR